MNTLSQLAMAFLVATSMSVASAKTHKSKAKAKAHVSQSHKHKKVTKKKPAKGHKAAVEYMKAGKKKNGSIAKNKPAKSQKRAIASKGKAKQMAAKKKHQNSRRY